MYIHTKFIFNILKPKYHYVYMCIHTYIYLPYLSSPHCTCIICKIYCHIINTEVRISFSVKHKNKNHLLTNPK